MIGWILVAVTALATLAAAAVMMQRNDPVAPLGVLLVGFSVLLVIGFFAMPWLRFSGARTLTNVVDIAGSLLGGQLSQFGINPGDMENVTQTLIANVDKINGSYLIGSVPASDGALLITLLLIPTISVIGLAVGGFALLQRRSTMIAPAAIFTALVGGIGALMFFFSLNTIRNQAVSAPFRALGLDLSTLGLGVNDWLNPIIDGIGMRHGAGIWTILIAQIGLIATAGLLATQRPKRLVKGPPRRPIR